MCSTRVSFSIASHAAWAPGLETHDAWLAWADDNFVISGTTEPAVRAMPALLRRRAGFLGKMALEVAYQCLGDRTGVPMVFCSRHGEATRSFDLLADLAGDLPLSPTSFGLSVHNAGSGLFTIARGEHANAIALAAGQSTIELAVIEACGLLADGEQSVLLVAYDNPLPAVFAPFQDCDEQPHAWAWLMQAAGAEADAISLAWSTADTDSATVDEMPGGLQVLRFHLRNDAALERTCGTRRWLWSRNV